MDKVCSKCGISKPLTSEFFHRGKDTKEGFKSACKDCRAKEKKTWRDENKDRINEQSREYYKNNKEVIGEKSRERYFANHEENRMKYKKYYAENKEKERERLRNFYNVPENRKKKLAYSKRYAEENREKVNYMQSEWRKKNKTKYLQYLKEYRLRDHVRAYRKKYKRRPDVLEKIKKYKQSEQGRQVNKRSKHKRRSIEREVLATLTLSQWNKCLEHFNKKCAYCGQGPNEIVLTQEHFVPVIKGGEYTVKNIIPACGSCNFSKSDRDFFDWFKNQKFYSIRRQKKILKYLDIKDNQQQIALF